MTDSPDQPPDGTLIAEILSGRRERFALLVARYQPALLRMARSRLGRHEWAEDAVQETFLCAFKSLHSYDSRFSFRTWLWTILLNQCRRQLQRQSRRPLVRAWSEQAPAAGNESRQGQRLVSGEAPPFASLLHRESCEQLEAMLEELPDNQADALRLRFFGGLQFQEIADTMGCSLSTAKNRVRWGLTKLSQRAAARDMELSQGIEISQGSAAAPPIGE